MAANGTNGSAGTTLPATVDVRRAPCLSHTDIVQTIKDLKAHLMGQNSAHKGLKAMTARPTFTTGGDREDFAERLTQWKDDKKTHEKCEEKAYSIIYLAAGEDPQVKLIRELYTDECEEQNKEPLARELLELLLTRFKDETSYELTNYQKEFDSFMVINGEDLEVAVTRHTSLIVHLTRLKQAPSEEKKKISLMAGLENGDDKLDYVKMMLTMGDDQYDTYAKQIRAIRKYSIQQKNVAKNKKSAHQQITEASVNALSKMPCDHCGINGHDSDHCHKKTADRAWHARQNGKGKGAGRGGGKGGDFGGRSGGRKGGKGKGGKGAGRGSHYERSEPDAEEAADLKVGDKRQ